MGEYNRTKVAVKVFIKKEKKGGKGKKGSNGNAISLSLSDSGSISGMYVCMYVCIFDHVIYIDIMWYSVFANIMYVYLTFISSLSLGKLMNSDIEADDLMHHVVVSSSASASCMCEMWKCCDVD